MLGSDSDSGSASCSLCDPRMTKGGKRNSVTSKRHSGTGSVSLNLDPQVDEPINFTSNLDSNLQNAPVVSWIFVHHPLLSRNPVSHDMRLPDDFVAFPILSSSSLCRQGHAT